MWAHDRCRSRAFSRQEFRETYEHFAAEGHDAGITAIQFLPNVSHAERQSFEAEAAAYYAANYPLVEYRGFVGFEENATSGELTMQPRSEQPFYFPTQYVEPVVGNEAILGFDPWSSPPSHH